MIITIQLQSPEEMAWLQPLLQTLKQADVKVNIQTELPEPQDLSNYSSQALISAVEQAQILDPFRRIQDPVAWQKQLRDEWE